MCGSVGPPYIIESISNIVIHVHMTSYSSVLGRLVSEKRGGVKVTKSSQIYLVSRVEQRPKYFNNNWDRRREVDQSCQTFPGPVSITCQNKYFYRVMNDIASYKKGERGKLYS